MGDEAFVAAFREGRAASFDELDAWRAQQAYESAANSFADAADLAPEGHDARHHDLDDQVVNTL